jgi:Unconventional myosin tail, actin- and lipid-binding
MAVITRESDPLPVVERKIPLVMIKAISMSNMRDDWLALNVNASEEGDPVLSCYFKTEIAASLLTLTQASMSLHVAPTHALSRLMRLSRSQNPLQGQSLLPSLYRENPRLLRRQGLLLHRSLQSAVPSVVPSGSATEPPPPGQQQFCHLHLHRRHDLRNQRWHIPCKV